MSDKKTTTTKKKKSNSGQFKKGNSVGSETRFQKENKAADKYSEKYCDMLLEFFSVPEPTVIYEEFYDKDGNLTRKTPKMIMPPKYPTFELFAAKIGVVMSTLTNWRAKYPRFDTAYVRAKEMQLGIAKLNGITKQYDSNFAKFILVNDHDMVDKSALEQTQEKPFEVNINVVKKPQ
jgi:hypothetical protein